MLRRVGPPGKRGPRGSAAAPDEETSGLSPEAVEDALAMQLAELSGHERPTVAQLRRLGALAARSGRASGARAVASGRWASEVIVAAAGHLPVRDLATLQAHHHGLTGPPLAEALVRNASRTAGAVGITAGTFAAASATTPVTWSTLPAELLVETLVVIAIEMKLVAELHVVAGTPFTGPLSAQSVQIAHSWADRRGIAFTLAGSRSAADLLNLSTRRQLTSQVRKRLTRKTGRNLATLTPFLAGAAAGAVLNRRATRALGADVAHSLGLHPPRRRGLPAPAPALPGWPAAAAFPTRPPPPPPPIRQVPPPPPPPPPSSVLAPGGPPRGR
jgi:hypothetical protein